LRRLEALSGGDPADDLPIDEAERTPLQANGGSNGNGEVCKKNPDILTDLFLKDLILKW
jgi:hypothetical protein